MQDASLATITTLADRADDAALAAWAARGDHKAFERLVRRHHRLLFRAARSILRTDADAEAALQQSALRAWQALARLPAGARPAIWLLRIVVGEALARRHHGVAAAHPAPAALTAPPAPRPEACALIEARIDALPEALRTVFVLRAIEALSVEEVAAALKLPEPTVSTRFLQARGLLHEALTRDIEHALEQVYSADSPHGERSVAELMAQH
ncbi:MAG: sigma-70 family RNA polymerase sigma factor [Rubrivivax sp.]